MTTEVTFDLNFELSGLNYLCSSASVSSILLKKPFIPRKEGGRKEGRKEERKEGQNGLVDLRARTSPQITTSNERNFRVIPPSPCLVRAVHSFSTELVLRRAICHRRLFFPSDRDQVVVEVIV